jgi:magnesium transporter
MLGIVTIDDLMDVAEGEFTEDMFRLAGINWSEEEVGRSTRILDASLGQVLKLRLPWLLVALAGGLMAGGWSASSRRRSRPSSSSPSSFPW